MLDMILDYFKKIMKSRILPLVFIYLLFAIVLIHKVFSIQVTEQKDIAENKTDKDVVVRETKASRGNIYDCNGVLLAYNKLSYNITLSEFKNFESNDEENRMILKMIRIIEGSGGKLLPDFFIKKNKKGELFFDGDKAAELRFKRDAYKKKSIDELGIKERNASPEEVFEHLRTGKYMFGISDDFSRDDTLKIMNLRFALLLNTYNKTPISVAMNVSENVVAAIKEYSSELPGVEITRRTYRVYNESKYFAHMMGYTGAVNETELAEDKEKYYSANDQIGKTGLEAVFESYLRGKKGVEEATLDADFSVTDVKVISEPKSGDDLYLTVDSKLQKACYHILEKDLATVLLSRIHNSASAGEKGKNSSKIMIPIYDVYNALFYNNVIRLDKLANRKNKGTQKRVYEKYQVKEKNVLRELRKIVSVNSSVTKKKAGKEMAEYLEYLYDYIKKQGILQTAAVNEADPVFRGFLNDTKSLSEYLKHAIAMKWINLDSLHIGSEYMSTEEVFSVLSEKLFSEIVKDPTFEKMIYKMLIYNYEISGTEVCLILYEQGRFKKDEKAYGQLVSGAVSAYYFIREKIKSLEITPAELALDPCSGSIVITDPKTGHIKALVSYPSYDNNKLANQISPDYYKKLQEDASYPLINRPVQQKTAPGSTFKTISAAAALQTGVVTEHETVYDKVVFDKLDKPATCWSNVSHRDVDIVTAIEVSCNYFFYEMGYRMSLDANGKYNSKLGLEKLNRYAAMFGLKEKETSGIELYEYEPSISDTDSVRSTIGQGRYAFTPTQIARFMSSVANGGKLNYLTLVEKIQNPEGKKVKNTVSVAAKKKGKKIELPEGVWKVMKEGLYEVVNGDKSQYTEIFNKIDTVVAGKSGTAQFSTLRGNHALFTSFAPFQDPELCVTVVMPYAYTSANAIMVAADFYEYYFGERDTESVINEKAEENVNQINAD